MDQAADAKWLKLTNHGEWATHTVSVSCREMNSGHDRTDLWQLALVFQNKCVELGLGSKKWVDKSRKPISTQRVSGITYCCLQYFPSQTVKWPLVVMLGGVLIQF